MKWVTRARPKTDRIACPWLVRRFILIDAFELGSDPALRRLGRIVHAADISDDQRLLEKGSFVYDALYAWCRRHPEPAAHSQ